MNKCLCGCGEEIPEGKKWVNGGHAAKWRKEQNTKTISKEEKTARQIVNHELKPKTGRLPKALCFFGAVFASLAEVLQHQYIYLLIPAFLLIIIGLIVFFKRKNKKAEKTIDVDSPEELIEDISKLPKWAINKSKPYKIIHPGKDYIQVVLLSKILGSKAFWAEWDGMMILRLQNRAYRVPKENIYGDIFLWDMDKKQSITELISIGDKDAESSFHELQLFNMAYSVGRAAGANDLLNNLKLILIGIGISLMISVLIMLYLNMIEGNIQNNINSLGTTINIINQTVHK